MDSLLSAAPAKELLARYGREAVKGALRAAIADGTTDAALLVTQAAHRLEHRFAPSLKPVINATGVLLHTNLGRAPLSPEACAALARIAPGYSTLELDCESGGRGRRQDHVRGTARQLFGCEDAIAVNNNASAVFLALCALARGRRVLVSRGELVAIGGSFKIPEILEASGAVLAEVGTTNRTAIADYRRGLDADVALILTVHPSNYEIRGYAARPSAEEIAALAREAGLPWVHDHGTGCVVPLDEFGVPGEPTVASILAAGADLVTFSTDKLFGGPQAGFLVGRAELVARAAAHPVARVVRPGKMTFAAVGATLAAWSTDRWRELPIYRKAAASLASLEERGAKIREAVGPGGSLTLDVLPSEALFGGGTSPEKRFPSRAVAVSRPGLRCDELARKLRLHATPILARVEENRVWLDLRSIDPAEDNRVIEALRALTGEAGI
jgi:L-seryl-tRNA(Ser) seleniumtransferase